MNKAKKITLVVAGLLVLFGVVISGIAATMGALNSNNLKEETQTFTEKISKVNISLDFDDIIINPTDTDSIKITYFTGKTKQYDYEINNGTLEFKALPITVSILNWIDYIDFDFTNKHRVLVELPKKYNGEITLASNAGKIVARDLSGILNVDAKCGDIEILNSKLTKFDANLSFGDIDIKNVTADTLNIENQNGDITLVDVSGDVNTHNNYGDVNFVRLSGKNIKIENQCGDIELEDVTANLDVLCDYGDIEFERIYGDKLAFNNNCGDIEGTILGRETDYTITSNGKVGNSNLSDRVGKEKTLNVTSSLGDIEIKFLK